MHCDNCSTIIVFGWIKEQGYHFCSKTCYKNWYYLVLSKDIEDNIIEDSVFNIYNSNCQECWNKWPNNLYKSYKVTSYILATSWKTNTHICCKKCAQKKQILSAIYSLIFWWWWIPWWITTPITVSKNIYYAIKEEDREPNKDLKEYLKQLVAIDMINEQKNI